MWYSPTKKWAGGAGFTVGSIFYVVAAAGAPAPDELASRVDAIRRAHGVSTAAVLLVEGDRVVLERAFGITDWASGRPVDAESRYKVGSISKAFTGIALVKAEARGLLRLDRPLNELLATPPYSNPWEKDRPLTAAMLLEHTAGWYDMSRAEFDSRDPKPLCLAEALALNPASRLSHWPPGMHSEYSNSGPGVAGYVLEQVSGERFEAFVEREVFQPLGMAGASFLLDAETQAHLVQGYDRDGKTPIPYWHIAYRPAGGLNLRPRDMAPFLSMLLARGRHDGRAYLSPAEVRRLETPTTTLAAKSGLDFGYGLGIYAVQHRGHTLYTHGGDGDGYLARFAYSPAAGRGYFIVITAFNHAPLNEMTRLAADWLVAPLPAVPEPPPAVLAPAALDFWRGRYRPASVRFPSPGWDARRLKIGSEDGVLYTQEENGRRRRLIPVTSHHFRRAGQTTATIALLEIEDGSRVLQSPDGNWLAPPHRSGALTQRTDQRKDTDRDKAAAGDDGEQTRVEPGTEPASGEHAERR